MKITENTLKTIYPKANKASIAKYLPFLNTYFDKFEINTVERVAAFLAQVGHESMQFLYTEELASGAAYEGNIKNLGNTQPGDGKRFKGRGLIQITGRHNYTALDKWLHENKILVEGVSIVEVPEMLATYDALAVVSAFWFWSNKKLNTYATRNVDDFVKMTKIINGGTNGLEDRQDLWKRALTTLS